MPTLGHGGIGGHGSIGGYGGIRQLGKNYWTIGRVPVTPRKTTEEEG